MTREHLLLRICLACVPFAAVVAANAAPAGPRIAIVYAGGETTGPFEIRRAVDPDSVHLTVFAPGATGEALRPDTRLDGYDLVFIDGSTPGLTDHAAQLSAAAGATRVVMVTPTPGMSGNVDLTMHPAVEQYWANPSQDNYRHLVRYLVARVLGRPAAAPAPPVVYPTMGFYHPRAPHLFESLETLAEWERADVATRAVKPADDRCTVGLAFTMTSYVQKNVAHVDALIAAVERRGHRAIALAYRGGPDPTRFLQDGKTAVDVLIQVGSVFAVRDRQAFLDRLATLDVPVLSAFHHHSQNETQYKASPTGLLPMLGSAVVEAEQEARFEPMAITGRGAPRGDSSFVAAFDAAIEWRVERALGWAKLRHTPNVRKRLLFTYWSQGGGKANVGGDPDDFLDVPATIVRLLHDMRARGYDVGPGPLPDRDTIARRMALEGSNVGNWAPGELAGRVARGDVRLIAETDYRAWFDALPAERRHEIVEMWGPPPGNVGVHTDATGRRSLVVPGLVYGNVVFAPNPDWGYLQDAKALMSTGALPPHHQYVAFFLWMQKTWRADAWVSFFSNISLQGGKPAGPLPDDHIGLLLGAVPHLHPERLGANGGLKTTRKALGRTTSWYSLVRPSDVGAQHASLRAILQRYASLEDDALRPDLERLVRAEIERSGFSRLVGDPAHLPIEDLVATVQREIDRLDRLFVPSGSKVLGTAAEGDVRVDMVAAMLGRDLTSRLPGPDTARASLARGLVQDVVGSGANPADAVRTRLGSANDDVTARLATATTYAANLASAPREVEALFAALDGRWIAPGSMDDPLRRPDALPPGRSVYNFDSAEVPTIEAEAVGVRQADALIAAHRERHGGACPTSMAFAIFSGEIAKNRGITEAQILHLLGTRAVRDARGIVTGVALIPREALGRPRVDILLTTSGTYRDHYPDVMALIAKAAQLAATSPEDDNPVRKAMTDAKRQLREQGMSAERASVLAQARVFAPAPGAYSPSIQFLAKSGDQRGDERKMAELYTSRLSHAYGDGLYGEAARPAFERQLARVDGATFTRSDVVNGMLDNPMPAGFLGGLNIAAKAVTGRNIDLYVSNLRDDRRPTIESAASEIQRELRTRYFNTSWLKEMQEHGYEGARTFMYLTDHLDLWHTTASQTVSSEDWGEIKRVYLDDEHGLDMDRFFDRYNPHAQQVLLGNLLGAAARGHWQATDAERSDVSARLARSAAMHGIACEASLCRNPTLTRLVTDTLSTTAEGRSLAAKYTAAIDAATKATPAPETAVTQDRDRTPPAALAHQAGRSAPGPSRRAAPVPSAASRPASPRPPRPLVTGRVLEAVTQPTVSAGSTASSDPRWLLLAFAAGGAILAGWIREGRAVD
jgi:cobaltochelatase CobN